jgi:ferredoxin
MAYKISEDCTACGTCIDECPVEAISEGDIYKIDPRFAPIAAHALMFARLRLFIPHNQGSGKYLIKKSGFLTRTF